jgi:4-amino-4-deoxy-L-arabinose transferase-like glycosyltransferase
MSVIEKRLLIVIIGASVALRVAAAVYLGNQVIELPGTFDQISYHNLALRVLGGYGFTFSEAWWPANWPNAQTAHWSYLYTGYLILVYKSFGNNPVIARLIQAILVGILQPCLAYLLGRQVFGNVVGLISAALMAIYTYFIYYSATLMTESFYITAILASFYFAFQLAATVKPVKPDARNILAEKSASQRRLYYAVCLGLTLGATLLLRQLFLLILPFIFLWLILASRKLFTPLVISSVVIALMIIPITLFNYSRFNRFVLLNTNAGYAFFWGNHPIYGTKFIDILPPELGSYQSLIPIELRRLDEAALDQALLKLGIGFILDDPQRYILLSLSRIPSYFRFWPSKESGLISNIARVTSFGLMWPFMLYGLVLSLFQKPTPFRLSPASPVLMLYVYMLVYTGIHLLTWTLIRYRLPVDAVLILFAGLAFKDLLERIPFTRRWFNAFSERIQVTVAVS